MGDAAAAANATFDFEDDFGDVDENDDIPSHAGGGAAHPDAAADAFGEAGGVTMTGTILTDPFILEDPGAAAAAPDAAAADADAGLGDLEPLTDAAAAGAGTNGLIFTINFLGLD